MFLNYSWFWWHLFRSGHAVEACKRVRWTLALAFLDALFDGPEEVILI
jgi:hypothetical protein